MKYALIFCGAGLLVLPALFALHGRVGAPAREPLARVAPDCGSTKGLARVICLADAFKATLTPSQLARVQLPYSKTDAARWSNFPQQFSQPKRVGIGFSSLNATQLAAAKALLASVLAPGVANEGYNELEGVWAADDYIAKATNQAAAFGEGNYYMAFLGTPSATARWELQYGGHHYAFANTYQGGRAASVTPSFRGAEPIIPVQAHGHTYQPMAQEHQAFAALLGSLGSREQATARLTATFHDVLLGPGQDGQFPAAKQGVRVGELSVAQQQLVLKALKLYVNDLDPATAAGVLATYTAELPATYLAYAGSGTMGKESDYVRLDGPHIWLEYSTQPGRAFPGTVHPHSVWRDRVNDYGGN